MIEIKKVHTMKLLKVSTLFLLLFIQGCSLKEDVIYTQPVQNPVLKAPIQVATPKKVPLQTVQPVTVIPSVKTQVPVVSTGLKVMKFSTINNKTITMTGDSNIINVTNPEYRGKEVVLYLFGRDCHHCKKEVSQIRELAKKPNIKVIGIHAHKMIGDSALKAYAKKVGYNFDILSFKNDITIIKYLKKVGIWYGGTPAQLLIDRGGNVKELSIPEILNR